MYKAETQILYQNFDFWFFEQMSEDYKDKIFRMQFWELLHNKCHKILINGGSFFVGDYVCENMGTYIQTRANITVYFDSREDALTYKLNHGSFFD